MDELQQIPLWTLPRMLPGGYGDPMTQMPQQQPSGPAWLQKLRGAVNPILNGPPSPYLNPQEQQYANQQRRQAMTAALLQSAAPRPAGTVSPIADFGTALGAGQQAGQQAGTNALQMRMLQAQLAQKQFHNVPAGATVLDNSGKPIYQAPQQINGINSRFGNPMMTQNGKAVIFDRQTGAGIYADTQTPWDGTKDPLNKVQTVTNPDGSISVVNLGSVMGQGQPQGQPQGAPPSPAPSAVQPLVTREDALRGIADKAAAETRARELTTSQTAAQIDLPRAINNAEQAVQSIDALRNHPGLPYITGWYSKAPIVPQTEQAGAEALAQQIEGKTFLEAYNTLKGGGQITEVEGKKASAAIARLYRAQKTEDYKSALGDLKDVINAGLNRAKIKAGQPAEQSKDDPLGLR